MGSRAPEPWGTLLAGPWAERHRLWMGMGPWVLHRPTAHHSHRNSEQWERGRYAQRAALYEQLSHLLWVILSAIWQSRIYIYLTFTFKHLAEDIRSIKITFKAHDIRIPVMQDPVRGIQIRKIRLAGCFISLSTNEREGYILDGIVHCVVFLLHTHTGII